MSHDITDSTTKISSVRIMVDGAVDRTLILVEGKLPVADVTLHARHLGDQCSTADRAHKGLCTFSSAALEIEICSSAYYIQQLLFAVPDSFFQVLVSYQSKSKHRITKDASIIKRRDRYSVASGCASSSEA
jgi:hypothetical protein